MSQLAQQQHWVHTHFLGVRLYLLKQDLPEGLRDTLEGISHQIELALKPVVDCITRRQFSFTLEQKLSITLDIWKQVGETSEQRVQRFQRYASLINAQLSEEQREAFFNAIKR